MTCNKVTTTDSRLYIDSCTANGCNVRIESNRRVRFGYNYKSKRRFYFHASRFSSPSFPTVLEQAGSSGLHGNAEGQTFSQLMPETWVEMATTANTIWVACRPKLSKKENLSKYCCEVTLSLFLFSTANIALSFDCREMLKESVSDLRSTMCELQERLHSVDGEGNI